MKPIEEPHDRPLSRKQAARYVSTELGYPLSPTTLETMASKGNGPRFFKIGRRAFYFKVDLKSWLASRTTPMFRSTSDQAAMMGGLSCPR